MATRVKRSTRLKLRALAQLRLRDAFGHFLSREAVAAREAESRQRLLDVAFLSPEIRKKRAIAEARKNAVAREKTARAKRYKANPSKYRLKTSAGDKQTLADVETIQAGKIPKRAYGKKHGEFYEYVWAWQGANAIYAAQEFLLHAKLPADAQCYLAVGNGYGKNSAWVGTTLGTQRDVWRRSQTFLQGKSGNIEILNELLERGERSELARIWAEVTVTTRERMK